MSDYIKRESRTFIEIADDLNDLVTELNDKIVESIREKNADVEPVVRCKDCKRCNWYTGANGKKLCFCLEHGSSGHSGDDYCSYGERKDDEIDRR